MMRGILKAAKTLRTTSLGLILSLRNSISLIVILVSLQAFVRSRWGEDAQCTPFYLFTARTHTDTQTAQHGTCQCRCLDSSYWTWRVCPSPVALATRSRLHWVIVDQTCPTKCHSEPYGFKIIGRGHRKKSYFLFSYIDALRTVHLVGCEAITVSSCLTDNMAKGIHLKMHNKQHNKVRADARTQINKARSARKHKQQNKT